MTLTAIGQWNSGGSSWTSSVGLNFIYQPLNVTSPFPNITGGGNADICPSGFSGLVSTSGPYRAYRVLGSAIQLEVLSANSGDNLGVVLCTSGPASALHAHYVSAVQSAFSSTRIVGFGQGSRSVMRRSLSVAQVGGVADTAVLDEDDYSGTATTVPVENWLWEVWIQTCDAANSTAAIAYQVRVSYDVLLEAPAWNTTTTTEVDEKTLPPKASRQYSRSVLGAAHGVSSPSGQFAVVQTARSGAKPRPVETLSDKG